MHSLLELFRNFAQREDLAGTAFIVGGAVRDIILGKELRDIDIALKGDAPGIAKRFAHDINGSFVFLDSDFGTARVVKGDQFMDLSVLRGDSIYTDLAGRDITINAMAIPLKSSNKLQVTSEEFKNKNFKNSLLVTRYSSLDVIDPFNGQNDLLDGIIRMVSEENLIQDPLRLLRVYRFAAALHFSIEKHTLGAARKHAVRINSAAVERIADELRHILRLDASYDTINGMVNAGLLPSIFPEVGKDAWERVLPLYGKVEEILDNLAVYFPGYSDDISNYFHVDYRRVCLKLSTLFSNSEAAGNAALRLKMSGKEVEFIYPAASGSRRIPDLYDESKSSDKKAPIAFLKKFQNDIYPLIILGIAHAGLLSNEAEILSFCRKLLSFYHEEIRPRMEMMPLITGNDLIREFHLTPSPLFKKILTEIEDKTLAGEISSRDEALKAVRGMLKQGKE